MHSEGDQPWDFFGRNDAKAKTPVLWPPHAKSWLIGKDWYWEGLGAGGEGDDRGWDGWMASLTWWTWVWVNSRSWWWTGRPGVLRFMGSQRVGHDWATDLIWSELHHLLWYSYPWYDISILYIKMINFILYSQMYLNFWYFLFVAKDLSFYCSLKHCLKYFQLYSSAGNKFCWYFWPKYVFILSYFWRMYSLLL